MALEATNDNKWADNSRPFNITKIQPYPKTNSMSTHLDWLSRLTQVPLRSNQVSIRETQIVNKPDQVVHSDSFKYVKAATK